MSDREEIEGLMLAYCRAIDSGSWEAFRALMGAARWLVEGEAPAPASANNVIVYDDGTPRTKHVVTNIAILVDPEGHRAEGHSYVTVYQQVPGDQLRTIFAGARLFGHRMQGWRSSQLCWSCRTFVCLSCCRRRMISVL